MREIMNTQEHKQKNYPLVMIVFLILTYGCLLMLSRGNSIFSRIGCYALILFSVFLPIDDVLNLIAIILPTGNIYKLGGGYTAIPFLLLVYIVKSFIKNGSKISADTARPLMWTMVLFIVSIFTTTIHNIRLIEIVPFFMHLVFIVVALRMNNVNEEEKYKSIAFYFLCGTLLVCAGTMIFPGVSRSISNISVYSRANPGFASTWDFGRSLSISIAFVIVDFLKTRKHLVLDTVLVLVMLYFLIQCGRFSMLLGLGALLIFIPFAYGTDKPLRQRIGYSVIMMVIMAIAAYFMIRYVYASMAELRGYGASENGRYGVWETYFTYLNANPSVVLFGVGGGAISIIASSLNTATAHNIILEKMVEVGIVGLVIFLFYFVTLYRGKTVNPTKNINVLPLITFLGTALTQGTTGNVAFALLLAICVADRANLDDEFSHGGS